MDVKYPGFKGGDRTSIELPEVQRQMLGKLFKMGKPIVYVNCSGSAIALAPEKRICSAIVQAWYGGQCGGQALADLWVFIVAPLVGGALAACVWKGFSCGCCCKKEA
jgi:beta-glucosidase